MDKAKQHWKILQRLGTDLANRVREFMVIGYEGEGLLVATEDGLGYWLGTMQFGLGESRTTKEPIALDVPGLVSMAQNKSHILLLNKRGEIYSMGHNYRGQLGLGTVDQQINFSPQLIPSPHKFISVRCGDWHSLALTEDGKVWAWGWNCIGQVCLSKLLVCISSPRQIPDLDPHRVVAIDCGDRHCLALTDRGEVYAWGANDCGQFGFWSEKLSHWFLKYQNPPTRIPIPSPVQSIAACSHHTLLLTQTGEVWTSRGNECGELGLPTTTAVSSKLSKVEGLPPISQIASHSETDMSIAMSSDKRCFVWGHLVNYVDEIKEFIEISKPMELSLDYSTVESPISFYSTKRNTPHSVQISETPPSPLSVRMSRMFDNPETSPDVQFVVEQRTIHAHRIILSNSSDYFSRMFSERSMAPVDPEDPIVKVTISDHSYQTFHAFLRFIYTDSLEVYFAMLPELFKLASQYLVPDLQQLCISRMRTTLTPATCCLYYPLTQRHSLLPELATFQQELVQFAFTRMSEITPTASYQSMEPDLRDILTNSVQNLSVT